MSEYLNKIIERAAENLNNSQQLLIEKKLSEKGFGHLVPLKKSRFPKIAFVKHAGWTYCYADNGSEDGVFIVAFSDYKIDLDSDKFKTTISFRWQDTRPLVQFKESK